MAKAKDPKKHKATGKARKGKTSAPKNVTRDEIAEAMLEMPMPQGDERRTEVVEEEDDLLALPEQEDTAPAKPVVKGTSGAVKTVPCRATCGGTFTLWDRTKGAPVDPDVAPEKRWAIIHDPSGRIKLLEKKRESRKLLTKASRGEVKELLPDGAAPAPASAKRSAPQTQATQETTLRVSPFLSVASMNTLRAARGLPPLDSDPNVQRAAIGLPPLDFAASPAAEPAEDMLA